LSSSQQSMGNVAAAFRMPMGKQISCLIFDLDGTLYLNGPVRRAMLWKLLRAGLTRPASTWRESRVLQCYRHAQEQLRGSPEPLSSEQLRIACALSGVAPEQAERTIAYWMEEAPLEILAGHLRPGIVDLLEAAQSQGIRLGVLSDYPAKRKLLALGLERYFPVVLAAQDMRVGVFKPSPKGLRIALQDLGSDPDSSIYIGDRSTVDGETAHRAGVAGLVLGQPQGSTGQGWMGVPDVPAVRMLLKI